MLYSAALSCTSIHSPPFSSPRICLNAAKRGTKNSRWQVGKWDTAVLSQCWSGVHTSEQRGNGKKEKSLKDRKRPSSPSLALSRTPGGFCFVIKWKEGKRQQLGFSYKRTTASSELWLNHRITEWFISGSYHHISVCPTTHSSFTRCSGPYWFELHSKTWKTLHLSHRMKANFLSHEHTSIWAQSSRLISAVVFAKLSPAHTS